MRAALPAITRESAPPSTEETVAATVSEFWALVRRSFVAIVIAVVAATLLATLFLINQTPLYRASSAILVDPQALQVVGKDIVRSDTAASIDFANIDSQALVMTSTSVLDQLATELKLDEDPAYDAKPGLLSRLFGGASPAQTRTGLIENLRQSVTARRVDNSLVFELTVSHPNADQAARVANALASIYLRQGSEGRGAAVKRANESLLGQLASLRGQLNDAETAVETFRSANGLVSTGEAGLIVNQQLKDIYTGITAAETDVARLAARRDQLAKLGPDALLSDRIPEALNSPTVTALRSQYADTAREAARFAETLLPRHPRLIEARGELAVARKQLADELDRIRSSIVEDYAQARANLDKLKERAAALTKSQATSSEAEIRLRQLESEAEAVRQVYNVSLSRAKELEQQAKIETSNSRLISAASAPLKPSKAPATIVLPAAALFGACLGLACAFLLDLLRGAASDARTVALMLGADAFTTVRLRPGGGYDDEANRVAIGVVARRLRDSVGPLNPAIVVAAGAPGLDSAVRRDIVVALGRALASLGEGVWFCLEGDRNAPTHIERIRPLHAEPNAPTGGALAKAAQDAQGQWVRQALHERSSTRDANSEFILLSDDHAPGLSASAGTADALIVIFELGRTRRQTLREMVEMLDPEGRRRMTVIGVARATRAPFRLPGLSSLRPKTKKAFA